MFVAGFIGSPAMNLVPAHLVGGGGAGRVVGFRPEHIELERQAGGVEFHADVEVVEYLGDEQIAHLRVKDAPLVAKLPVEQRLAMGDSRDFYVAQDKIRLFDAETEERVSA
jgi:ABC-type sugar transport system ATPase subunit